MDVDVAIPIQNQILSSRSTVKQDNRLSNSSELELEEKVRSTDAYSQKCLK